MPTLEEVAEIIKNGFADMSGQELKNVDVYNVEETNPGTYTYDASVYFRENDGEQASVDFQTTVKDDPDTFQNSLKTKIQEKRPDLAVTNMKVDNESGRFTRSLNRGKSKPKFDRIVPNIQNFNVDVQNPDFLEIKNVTLVKDSTGIDVSFVINTNLTNEKIYWRIKLATTDLDDGSDAFLDLLKSNANPEQRQGNVVYTGETLVGPKRVSQGYKSLTETVPEYSASEVHRVYIVAYFGSEPSFVTKYVKAVRSIIPQSVSMMPRLMWDFSNGNLEESSFSGLAWSVHQGSITSDAHGIIKTNSNSYAALRLYNTDNVLYDILTNGQFLRDVRITIKMSMPSVTSQAMTFVFKGRDVENASNSFGVLQFYGDSTTFQMYREKEPHMFLFNDSKSDYSREDWEQMTTWSWSLLSDQEDDGNVTDRYAIHRNGVLIRSDNDNDSGNTVVRADLNVPESEVGMHFCNNGSVEAYLEIKMGYAVGQKIEYISIEKI